MTDTRHELVKRRPLDEQLLQLEQAKDEGNRLFGQAQFDEALKVYRDAVDVYDNDEQAKGDEQTKSDEQAKSDKQAKSDEQEQSDEALTAKIRTTRSQIHANAAAVYVRQGMHEAAVEQCSLAIKLEPSYAKALVRRGSCYEALGQARNAVADYKRVAELDVAVPLDLVQAAQGGLARCGPAAAEEERKQLEELKSTLGGLANKFLGLFGMSTDNFQMVQDPSTGSYSINMKQ